MIYYFLIFLLIIILSLTFLVIRQGKVLLINCLSSRHFLACTQSKFFKIIAQRKLTKGIDINNIIIIREINNSKLIKIKERDSTVNFSLFIRYTRIRITAKNFNNKTAPVYFLFFNFFNQEKIAFYNPLLRVTI